MGIPNKTKNVVLMLMCESLTVKTETTADRLK